MLVRLRSIRNSDYRPITVFYDVGPTTSKFLPPDLSLDTYFWTRKAGPKKATIVVVVALLLLVLGISSLKMPKAFLIRSGTQRNFAYTFTLHSPQIYRLRFLN